MLRSTGRVALSARVQWTRKRLAATGHWSQSLEGQNPSHELRIPCAMAPVLSTMARALTCLSTQTLAFVTYQYSHPGAPLHRPAHSYHAQPRLDGDSFRCNVAKSFPPWYPSLAPGSWVHPPPKLPSGRSDRWLSLL